MGTGRTGLRGTWHRRAVGFARSDRAAGLMLSAATVVALVWANTATGSYHRVGDTVPSLPHFVGLHLSLARLGQPRPPDWILHARRFGVAA